MRLRLGNLRDTSVSRRQAEADAAVRKFKPKSPTAKTEAEAKAEEEAIAKAQAIASESTKPTPKPHIRPLSEAKAIESGANFLSESFLFLVAGGLIVFETMRSRRKEATRREDLDDRLTELQQSETAARRALVTLEKEVLHLKSKHGESVKSGHVLSRDIWETEDLGVVEDEKDDSWLTQIQYYFSSLSSLLPGTTQEPGSSTEGEEQDSNKPSTSAASPPSTVPESETRVDSRS